MNQALQSWLIALGPLAGVALGFLGAAYLQGRRTKKVARHRLENDIAELLAAATDVLFGARALRAAHGRRTRSKYYLRTAGDLLASLPELTSMKVLAEWETMRSMLASLMKIERQGLDDDRIIAIDAATILAPKLTRYFAAVALVTLGEDNEIADAARELTAKVTAISERVATRKGNYAQLESDLQKAMERFRERAEKRLGNLT